MVGRKKKKMKWEGRREGHNWKHSINDRGPEDDNTNW